MPYGGSVTISSGLRSPSSRATSSALVESPQRTRCLPQSHRSPAGMTGFSGSGGASLAFSSSGIASRSSISLGSKPVRLEVEIRGVEFLQLEREQFLVPVGPGDGAVHHQPEGLHLRRRPLVAEDHRHFGDAKLARGFQPKVAVDDFAVAAGEHRDLEAELADAAAHAIDGGVVLARIAGVEDELVDRPLLNARRCRLRNHSTPRRKLSWLEDSFGGCALRWPVEPRL